MNKRDFAVLCVRIARSTDLDLLSILLVARKVQVWQRNLHALPEASKERILNKLNKLTGLVWDISESGSLYSTWGE